MAIAATTIEDQPTNDGDVVPRADLLPAMGTAGPRRHNGFMCGQP